MVVERRVVHQRVSCIGELCTGFDRAGDEVVVAAGRKGRVEPAEPREERTSNEEIRGHPPPERDVALLVEEHVRRQQRPDRRRIGRDEADLARDDIRRLESDQAIREPLRLGPAIAVAEGKQACARDACSLVAGRVGSPGRAPDDPHPAVVSRQRRARVVPRAVVADDHLEGRSRERLLPQALDQLAHAGGVVTHGHDHRDERHGRLLLSVGKAVREWSVHALAEQAPSQAGDRAARRGCRPTGRRSVVSTGCHLASFAPHFARRSCRSPSPEGR